MLWKVSIHQACNKKFQIAIKSNNQEACQMQVDISRNKIEKVDQKLPLFLEMHAIRCSPNWMPGPWVAWEY